MTRYIGDLSDKYATKGRVEAARTLVDLADKIRRREVRSLTVEEHGEVIGGDGPAPIVAPTDVAVTVQVRGRHER